MVLRHQLSKEYNVGILRLLQDSIVRDQESVHLYGFPRSHPDCFCANVFDCFFEWNPYVANRVVQTLEDFLIAPSTNLS